MSTNKNPYTPSVVPNCYKCAKNRQKSNIYLKHGIANLVDLIKEIVDPKKPKNWSFDEENLVDFNRGDTLSHSLIVRILICAPKKEEDSQHHIIFKTMCIVNNKICDVIIDSGSSKNIISSVVI